MAKFSHDYSCKGLKCTVAIDIPIPLLTSVEEFANRVVLKHKIPAFAVTALKERIARFIANEEKLLHAQRVEAMRNTLLAANKKELCEKWRNACAKGLQKYSKGSSVIDTSFASLYKKLIHSSSLTSILNVEHAYAVAVHDLVSARNHALADLEQRQQEAMFEALSNSKGRRQMTDTEITTLAQRHVEHLEFENAHWEKELACLHNEQKSQYVEWLRNIDEYPQQSEIKARSLSQPSPISITHKEQVDEVPSTRLEESFTIHLGAQLKTTHNLRLLSTDVLDLCKHKANINSEKVMPEPQRLQTALTLYSNKLCALMLLVDDRLNTYSGIKRDFAAVCAQSTDFHFPDVHQQLEHIEQNVLKSNERVTLPRNSSAADSCSYKSGSSESSSETQEKKYRMPAGSFYVTKHSNLSEVHIVFHMVADDSLLGDITSRHPVILGLRNLLKACFKHDVVTLTIPLLLTLEMTEEMTIPWCMKRAELVFKCMKGFMMEMSSWADAESRNIQFLVPKKMSVETFNLLSNMLPGIFRQSNPIVGRSDNSK